VRYKYHYVFRDLRVGDVLMQGGGPVLLVKRVARSRYRGTYSSKKEYWHDGTFMHLMTGHTFTSKLCSSKIRCEIIFAPRDES
jgi:hypothetical protein